MIDRLKFFVSRLRERLWFKPLAICVLSVGLASLAKAADYGNVAHFVPSVSAETIETLLKIIAASMLVIATFAVGSMVSSYYLIKIQQTFPLQNSGETILNSNQKMHRINR